MLTDPGMTIDQARALGDWVASNSRNLTDIFVTQATAITDSPSGYWRSASGRASSPARERSNRWSAALVVAGDVIYNGVHMYLAQPAIESGFGPWRAAIDKVESLKPRHIVAGHQNKELDDHAERTIAETRQYLDHA